MNIKIFVSHTPNRYTVSIKHPLLYNVIAGSAFQEKKVPNDFYLDNQGQNISSKNKSYCELTTQYWAWKNVDADYYGFCHYRRLFSFSNESLEESSWGTVEYDYLTPNILDLLGYDEKNMRQCIERNDFLIAKSVDACCMGADNIYDQYKNATDLHIKDIELLLNILDAKYPFLSETARKFFKGSKFYPCNMFIMRKDLFQEYSSILFDVLEEFEQQTNMYDYSREGYRTTGHLGERLAGIYYLYIKENKKQYRLGELQIALLKHADAPSTVLIDSSEHAVPIVLAANDQYVPILYTCIQSLVEHISAASNYHIYIFHTDIQPKNMQKFKNLEKKNLDIMFIDVGSNISGYTLKAKEHITTETFYRFLILDILKEYSKVLYLDSDMIIDRDVAELYYTPLNNNLIGAVRDADFAGQCNIKSSDMKKYCQEVLNLENPFQYFQAGVLLLNITELNKITSVDELFKMADTGIYRFSDQDILNIVCKNRVLYLDMAWNLLFDCNPSRWKQVIIHAPHYILDEYENARKHPYIIHYAGWLKPWMHAGEDYGEKFWAVARKNEFYEVLLTQLTEFTLKNSEQFTNIQPHKKNWIELLRRMVRPFFPKNSKLRSWAIKMYFKLYRLK